MFVLFVLLLSVTEAIQLTKFNQFSIEIEANSTEYFMFKGAVDYAYFYQKNGNFRLWIVRNESHRMYHSPYENNLKLD